MLYLILIFILSFGVAVVAIQNSMPVQLTFFVWSFDSNLIVVVILSVIAGLLIAALWGMKMKAQHYLKNRKLTGRIHELEKENKSLKGQIFEYQVTLNKEKEVARADLPKADWNQHS